MILVFTKNANNSNEIKKEIVLASQHHVVVIPVRVVDVAPNDAFAYEFATRQWIDLFNDWERNIEALSLQIANILSNGSSSGNQLIPKPPITRSSSLVTTRPFALRYVLIFALAIATLGVGAVYLYVQTLNARPFYGVWSTKMTCPQTASANEFVFEFDTFVNDAHLHGQYGEVGKPSSLSLDGNVAADGSLVVYAKGYSGNPKFNQNNVPPGLPYAFQIPLKLDGARGTASVHLPAGRPCDFEFVKK